MINTTLKSAIGVFVMSLTLMSFLPSTLLAQKALKPDPMKKIEKRAPTTLQHRRVVPLKPCDGRDPAVVRVATSKRVMGGKGIVDITATIKNLGTENFVSGSGQQAVTIQSYNPRLSGPAAYETLKNHSFTVLNSGAVMTVRASLELDLFVDWNHRTAQSGECQSEREIIVFLNYDPDIYMDGNPENDDCNQKNNMKRLKIKYMVQCPW